MKHEKSCGAIIFYCVENEPRFLIVKYKKEHDYWGLVKGHIEENETEINTAVREIKEETGISDLKFIDCFRETERYSPKEDVIKEVVYFLAETKNNNVWLDKDELIDYKWLTVEEAIKRLKFKRNKETIMKAYTIIKNNRINQK